MASALFLVTMTAVLQAMPMLQAIILLGIYPLLPLMVVLCRYSVSMMVVGGRGGLYRQVLERAVVPGDVSGPELDPFHVPGRQLLPAGVRQFRRT